MNFNEGDMETWSAFFVFDREVDSFTSYDGEVVDTDTKAAFKVKPKGWNAKSKGKYWKVNYTLASRSTDLAALQF